MQEKDVTGIFRSQKHARKAMIHLISEGVSREDVHLSLSDDSHLGVEQFKLQSKISIVATSSAAIGGVVGALASNISQISPVVSAVLGVSLGVLVGGIIGSLIGAELTERDTQEMSDEEENCYLLHVNYHESDQQKIENMLRNDGAIKIKKAA